MKNREKWEPFIEQRGPSEAWGVRTTEGKIIITATHRMDGEDADVIARSHNARLEKPGEIWVESIVSHRTMMPIYRFQHGDISFELDLRAMRAHMDDLYHVLEAGITDAFIARWIQSSLMPDASLEGQRNAIGHMMIEFRKFRELLDKPVIDAPEGGAS